MAAFDHIRSAAMSLGVGATLLAGSVGFVGHAEARVGPGIDDPFAQHCRQIQDQYDHAEELYHDALSDDASAYAEGQIALQSQAWLGDGCQQRFGSIALPRVIVGRPPRVSVSATMQSDVNPQ